MDLAYIKQTGVRVFLWAKENYALFVALLIVTVISATAYHHDLITLSRLSERIASGNFDIYSKLVIGNTANLGAIMPPLVFLVDALFYFIVKITGLLNFNYIYTLTGPGALALVLLKTRYIIVFVASYFIAKWTVNKFTKDKAARKTISNLWITNPILLYFTFTQGNNDIYPAIVSFLFLSAVFSGSNLLAMVLLGVTAALKNYAIFLFLPTAIILARKDIKKIIFYLATAGAAYILPTLFYIKGAHNFATSAGEGIMMLKTAVPSHINYMIFPILYFLLIMYLFFSENDEMLQERRNDMVLFYCILTLSLLFATAFFIPNWILWLIPFIIFVIYRSKRLFYLYGIITAAVFAITGLTWRGNLDFTVFNSIFPSISPITTYIPKLGSATVDSLIASFLTATIALFIYFLIKDNKKTELDVPQKTVLWNLAPLLVFLLIALTLGVASLVR